MITIMLLCIVVGLTEVKGYDLETLEALRLDVMRVEGRIGALSQENMKVMMGMMKEVKAGLEGLQQEVAGLAVTRSGEGNGTATGVSDHPSPDLYPLLDALASRLEMVNVKMGAVAAAKAGVAEGWFELDMFTYWQRTWNPLLAAFFLGWGVYAAAGLHHKLLFLSLGCFFSPHLGGFVIVMYVGWGVARAWQRVVRAVRGSWLGRICCSLPVTEPDAGRNNTTRPSVRLLSARRLPHAFVDIELAEPSILESTRIERPHTFLGYIRSFFDPYVYVPVGHVSSLEAW